MYILLSFRIWYNMGTCEYSCVSFLWLQSISNWCELTLKLLSSKLPFEDESLFEFEENLSKSQSLTEESLLNRRTNHYFFLTKNLNHVFELLLVVFLLWMLNKDDEEPDLFIVEFSSYYNLKQKSCISRLNIWISYVAE